MNASSISYLNSRPTRDCLDIAWKYNIAPWRPASCSWTWSPPNMATSFCHTGILLETEGSLPGSDSKKSNRLLLYRFITRQRTLFFTQTPCMRQTYFALHAWFVLFRVFISLLNSLRNLKPLRSGRSCLTATYTISTISKLHAWKRQPSNIELRFFVHAIRPLQNSEKRLGKARMLSHMILRRWRSHRKSYSKTQRSPSGKKIFRMSCIVPSLMEATRAGKSLSL